MGQAQAQALAHAQAFGALKQLVGPAFAKENPPGNRE
jgi:hypothetical protein